jgi:two-component system cell cycle sensor histidine kinase/response regulator CckA
MKRILLVEDNLGDARLAQELLAESADFESHVTCVGRVSDAEDILLNQPIDLVLLDLSLPDSQGLEGLRRLQSLSKYAPIIVLSGSSDKALALEALKHGAQDYLIKGTINADALTRIIQYSIERKIAEVRYRSLVSNIPGVVYHCQSDQDCSMLYVSSPFERLTGYSPDEFGVALSSHYAELIHPDDRAATEHDISDAVSRKQPYSIEYRILHKDTTIRWVNDRGQSIGGNNGVPPFRDGVLFDITTQKHLEDKVRRADQQLGKARQFAALGHLAGGIAHDFNNLITAINGFADLSLKGLPTDSQPHAHIAQIRKASARAMTITRQLLALGQPNGQETTLVDLNLLLAEMERLIRLVIGSDRRIEILTEQLLGRVRINPGQLEQAILVLAANLFEGRSVEDRLQIETKSWEVSKEDAELLGFVFSGPYVVVTLRAWSHTERPDIVHALCPVSPGGKAISDWGFGLAGVLKTVLEHQGYFLNSRDEIGIREYQIVLPLAQTFDESWASCEPALQPSRTGTETVLVVDDEESIRKLLRALLEPEGYRVLEASGGTQAIELSMAYAKQIDLLIVDEVMPEISGHELSDRLVLDRPLMGILPMSTRNRELHAGKKSSLLKPFLMKPFTAEGLLRLVNESLNDGHARPMAEIEH